MKTIPKGDWAIEYVLINDVTVMNNDGIRALEILDDAWVLQPSGQRFSVTQMTTDSAILESNSETYYANFKLDGNRLSVSLSRKNLKETIKIEAEAITADVFVAAGFTS